MPSPPREALGRAASRSGRADGRRRLGRQLLLALELGRLLFEREPDELDLLVGQMLDADELGARLADRAQQFVELGLDRRAVPVLAVLDEEHGEEGQHRGRGVDDQLPGVRIVEQRARRRPRRCTPAWRR